MNFAALPPEINSLRIYTGPGSAPMRAAAAAWGGLSAELHSAVTAYESVVAELTGQAFMGPASLALTRAASLYAAWMSATAAQVDQTTAQANAAAAAYEAAFTATVPPSVVAANRSQLLVLIATNALGQNTAAIAANEAAYAEMWAQDAAAMYAYAAASATATGLAPFQAPPQINNPAGQANQAAAVGAAEATQSSSNIQSLLGQLASGLFGTSNNAVLLPGVAAVAGPAQGLADLITLPSLSDIAGLSAAQVASLIMSGGAWASADASTREILSEQDQLREVEYQILHNIDLFSPLTPSRPAGAIPLTSASFPSAAIGDAVTAGRLSVPISWAANAPEIRTLSYTTPLAGPAAGAAPAASLSGAGSAFSQMALAGMGGSALAGSVSRGRGGADAADASAKVQMPQRPATGGAADSQTGDGGADGAPGPTAMGIAAEIREFAELRDRGLITNDEYNEQKMRLLGR
ncbi:PPE family protein, SVP subgroup [[Mycobacterium] nativiensis]|uniref:PPE domain-containing protein n=1 Tax=[Mycobacterium] nativiensis TaxID=2855503 RepID=A0ABU5XX04_9MYCO|nr:PPE domain-containing protein [Mycolicibacter sp. MYC340]MEB3032509.1 PPE domain-containing protein [Mycolicibacter sp. MYC340]